MGARTRVFNFFFKLNKQTKKDQKEGKFFCFAFNLKKKLNG